MTAYLSSEKNSIDALLKQEENGRLGKTYKVYAGTRLSIEYKTTRFTVVGGPCLKVTYTYVGSLQTAVVKDCDVWSQTMEDGSVGSIGNGYTNDLSTSFDGVNDYVDFGDTHQYDTSDAFSVSLWAKVQNTAAQRVFFSKSTNDSNVWGYNLQHTSAGKLFIHMRSDGKLRSHTFTSTIPINTWMHLVLTYAGGANINGARVYLDSVVEDTPPSGNLAPSWLSGQSFYVARRSTSFHLNGNVDEMTVWDKALTSLEVAELYNMGIPTDPTEHSAASNLQSHYRMGDGDTFPTITDQQGTADGTMTNMDSGDFENVVPT
jgi:hypothetical protein